MRRFLYPAVAAAVLLACGGGYALAAGVLQPATIYGCVANGSIHNVSVTKAPTCPSGTYQVQWTGQAAVSASPSPSPSPTPTGGGGGGTASCSASSATWTSSSATGSEGVTDGSIYDSSQYSTYVNQDVWNQVAGWQQTMYACGGSSWTVTANMPAGNTAVVSYPDTQQIYGSNGDPAPLSSLPGLTSTFSVTDLAGQGFMTADGLNAVDFGYELSSTGGTTQTFALNSYTLSISS